MIALAGAVFVARSFAAAPSPKKEKLVDAAAGLWVLVCYCLAGFAPLLAEWVSV